MELLKSTLKLDMVPIHYKGDACCDHRCHRRPGSYAHIEHLGLMPYVRSGSCAGWP
jgi:hypothetical protein